MYVADMHCDSIMKVNADNGLVSEYNTSKKYPFLQFFAAFTPFNSRTLEIRRREVMKDFDIYAYECERLGLNKIEDVRSLCYATDNGLSSALFAIEGGGGLLADSDELFTLYKAGLRIMSFAWDTNELATGAYDECDEGLTREGVRMAKRCAELGITVDVSHLSDKSFYDLCENYPLPIIATHSNYRDVCSHKRNLTLDMAKIIVARGGVIGLNLYPDFLSSGGACIEDIIPHIDYHLEHFGDTGLGFGFDIDGTDGKYPKGIEQKASIHDRVIEMLLKHYPESTVRKIAGENVIDFLKGVL
ncbi:MAG: dipeptidase [Clostridia bacterium]|nr:dipeptidase [Clostridia bacterium]